MADKAGWRSINPPFVLPTLPLEGKLFILCDKITNTCCLMANLRHRSLLYNLRLTQFVIRLQNERRLSVSGSILATY